MAAGICLIPGGCSRSPDASEPRVIVLGIDGMDPGLLRELMDQGRMPNLAKLAAAGSFLPLGTSTPPQSPVAWSNFICGAEAGIHQIFDFIHRETGTGRGVLPYLSTSKVDPPKRAWAISAGRTPRCATARTSRIRRSESERSRQSSIPAAWSSRVTGGSSAVSGTEPARPQVSLRASASWWR